MARAKSGIVWLAKDLFDRYNKHNIAQVGGQLAYFFLLSMFPFVIFINALIGAFHFDPDVIQKALAPFLHNTITSLIIRYVSYISENKSIGLLSVGVVVEIFSASASVRALRFGMNNAYGAKPKGNPIFGIVSSMLFTLFMGIIVFVSVAILAFSQIVLSKLPKEVALQFKTISVANSVIWLLVVVILFFVILLTYYFLPDIRIRLSAHVPGTLFSLIGNLALTYGISKYVSSSVSFSVLYGSISSVIMLLLWMYFSGNILLLGAELNSALLNLLTSRKKISGGSTRR